MLKGDKNSIVAERSIEEILKRFDKKIKDPRRPSKGRNVSKIIKEFLKIKCPISKAADIEEEKFYSGGASDEWIKSLEPIGTNANKPHLEIAPWLIIIFAERFGTFDNGTKYKNYYVPESVGIATGFLITALHKVGLSVLTHTPNPMSFLNTLCERPKSNKPLMILAIGHASDKATVPKVAKIKKPIDEILTVIS